MGTGPSPAGTLRVRIATPDDAAGLAAIYAPIVRDTVISFEYDPPGADVMRQRVAALLPRWPWLVCERDGVLLGYVYASTHRERAAYQWAVEVSAYIAADARRHGVARALYGALFAMIAAQGCVHAYAGITLPNVPSVALHESLGFRKLGVYERIGFKFGAWHDVGWWSLLLREPPRGPAAPVPFATWREQPACAAMLSAAEARLRP
jgi:L-amino acid N-acyltransferase YncA